MWVQTIRETLYKTIEMTVTEIEYRLSGAGLPIHYAFIMRREVNGAGGGSVSTPISTGGVTDFRNLILRTLNDNQLLIMGAVASQKRSLTSILKELSVECEIPLSTLKLNARILRELNLISYGSIKNKREARLESLGSFIFGIIQGTPEEAMIEFSD